VLVIAHSNGNCRIFIVGIALDHNAVVLPIGVVISAHLIEELLDVDIQVRGDAVFEQLFPIFVAGPEPKKPSRTPGLDGFGFPRVFPVELGFKWYQCQLERLADAKVRTTDL
jgi:hypothetical protein